MQVYQNHSVPGFLSCKDSSAGPELKAGHLFRRPGRFPHGRHCAASSGTRGAEPAGSHFACSSSSRHADSTPAIAQCRCAVDRAAETSPTGGAHLSELSQAAARVCCHALAHRSAEPHQPGQRTATATATAATHCCAAPPGGDVRRDPVSQPGTSGPDRQRRMPGLR